MPQQPPQWHQQGPQGPPAQQPAAPSVVFQIGKRGKVAGLGLAVICGGIGLITIISMFTGGIDGGAGAYIGAGIIGGLFLLVGLAGLFTAVAGPSHRLVIDPMGMRLEGAGPRDWQVVWGEVGAVVASSASKVSGPFGIGRSKLIRLEFIPIDHQRFAAAHPQLQQFLGRQNNYGAYRIPLGAGSKTGQSLDAGLRAFAPQRYQGVVDEGIAWGFRYT